MIVVVEDPVSEAVARILLSERLAADELTVIGRKGRGYVAARARQPNRTAEKVSTFILVDQDRRDDCPITLMKEWFDGRLARFLTFQVAVFEVESWLLADAESLAAILNEFVNDNWRPEAAAARSPSLARALRAIGRLNSA